MTDRSIELLKAVRPPGSVGLDGARVGWCGGSGRAVVRSGPAAVAQTVLWPAPEVEARLRRARGSNSLS